MNKIIFSANDMGMSLGVNEGIIDAFKNGLLSQASVLATGQFLEDALEKSKANPDLTILAHLDLSNGKPLLESSWCLEDEECFIPSLGIDHTRNFTSQQYKAIELELRAQIDKLLDMGFKLSGLSAHKGFTMNKNLFSILSRICNEYRLVIRDERAMYKNFANYLVNGSVYSCHGLYGKDVNLPYFKKMIKEVNKQDEIVEFQVHPGICDEDLMELSTYNEGREADLEFLKSESLKKFLKDNDISITDYKRM